MIQESYNFNHPLTITDSPCSGTSTKKIDHVFFTNKNGLIVPGEAMSFFTIDNPAIVLETVKVVNT